LCHPKTKRKKENFTPVCMYSIMFLMKQKTKKERKTERKEELQNLKFCHFWYIWGDLSREIAAPQHPAMSTAVIQAKLL
jgi:hypothetical protein